MGSCLSFLHVNMQSNILTKACRFALHSKTWVLCLEKLGVICNGNDFPFSCFFLTQSVKKSSNQWELLIWPKYTTISFNGFFEWVVRSSNLYHPIWFASCQPNYLARDRWRDSRHVSTCFTPTLLSIALLHVPNSPLIATFHALFSMFTFPLGIFLK